MKSIPALSIPLRAQMFAHLATMEQSGLPTDRAFALLVLPPPAAARLVSMRHNLAQGRDIASAGQRSGLFSAIEVSLLEAAQNAGSPANLYAQLARQYEQQARLARGLRTRLLLPGMTLLLGLLVQPLPALVGGSLSFPLYLWGVIKVLLWVGLLGWLLKQGWMRLQTPPALGEVRRLDSVFLRLAFFGTAIARRNSRDFFVTLGLLLEAGVPMFDALPKALNCLSNSQLRADFQSLSRRVQAGQPLAKALQAVSIPDRAHLIGLVQSGEAGGTLPSVLLAYARHETDALENFEEQLALWLPRLVYVLVSIWVSYGLLSGHALVPTLPADLQ